MFRALATTALLFPLIAAADVDPKFAALRDKAEALGSVSQFIEKYIGDCGKGLEANQECLKNAKAYRDGATGKKFYMIITEDAATMMSLGTYDPRGDEFVINLTPFFPASDSAITHGQPNGLDANGNPTMAYLPIRATIPEGHNIQRITRMIQSRVLRLQVVFTPLGLWTLNKKGGGKITGVKAKLDAVLVTIGRTGEPIALWMK